MSDGLVKRDGRGNILHWMTNGVDAKEKDEALFRIWDETDGIDIADSEVQESFSQVKSRLGLYDYPQISRRQLFMKQIWKYAAIFILPFITGLAVWSFMYSQSNKDVEMLECFVPNGEQREVILSDGTKVMLNAGTILIYPEEFSKESRKVYLNGEAYFDVKRNEKSPFTVHTGRLNIEVLGTSFNVEAYSNDSEIITTLKTGKVRVTSINQEKNASIEMKPDEQVVYNVKSGKMDLCTVKADDYSAWTDGKMNFIERPLDEIMKVIGRKYDVEFRYGEQINLNELYTIGFSKDETIEQVMRVMKSIMENEVDFSVKGNLVYLYSNKKGGIMK